MKVNDFQSKILNATKWSALTEIVAKLITPITNMILARILVPEAFGVIATVTMLVSFAEMFADSGFQKYLVQHEFKDNKEKYQYTNVAFWTNLIISIILWVIIFIFREELAILVGNPGLGNVLAIACLQLPLTSFSSIQMALYKRDFNFKTLFLVRVVAITIPFIITIPLALLGCDYWSLIIGTLIIQFSNAIILTIRSKWKPKLFYSAKIFKRMFSFSIWSLIEAISIWLTSWVDSFIIANNLSQHELGVYKTSTSMVNSLMAIITATVIPVLFSTLSRLQDDHNKFQSTYYIFQRYVSILVLPLGVGICLFSDLATNLLLGSKWKEASTVIGVWALTSSIQIVFGHFCSEVYRAKGQPKLSFLAQVLHLVVLIPACIISSKFGFWALVYTRSWIRMQSVLVHLFIMKYKFFFPIMKILSNVLPTIISAVLMGIFGYFIQQISNAFIWDLITILLCVLFYFAVLLIFPDMRKEISKLIRKRLAEWF